MKAKRTLILAILVSTFAVGLAAQVAETRINRANMSWKKQPPLLRLKQGGEIIAELQILKPAKLKVDGGVETTSTGSFRSPHGAIEITADGTTPWRISGTDIEVEVVEKKTDTK